MLNLRPGGAPGLWPSRPARGAAHPVGRAAIGSASMSADRLVCPTLVPESSPISLPIVTGLNPGHIQHGETPMDRRDDTTGHRPGTRAHRRHWAPGLFVRDWALRSRLRFTDLNDASMWDEERFEGSVAVRSPVGARRRAVPGPRGRSPTCGARTSPATIRQCQGSLDPSLGRAW